MKTDRFKRGTERSQRDLKRPFEFQQQRKLICICTEGTVTERSYLDCVESVFRRKSKNQGKEGSATFSLVYATENKKTAPKYLLDKMKKKLERLTGRKVVGAWIVSDRDSWSEECLNEIKAWVNEDGTKRRWGLSNPRIEYWFGLHFQKKADQQTFEEKYKKRIERNDFTYEQIVYACKKARAKKQTISDLYDQQGSLMYEIVEFIGKEYQLCSEDSQGGVSWESVNS